MAQSGAGCQISAANTNRDGTGTMSTLWTAGANGAQINRIEIQAIVTTTAGMIRFFIYDGAATRLWKEVLVTAVTPSGSVAAFSDSVDPSPPLTLAPNEVLKVATNNAETFNVRVTNGFQF